MNDDSLTPLERHPLPTIQLWKLLKRFPLPLTDDGKPEPGSEDLHAAHAAVYAWLAKMELELGCPSYANSRDLSEFDPARRRYGLCPKCRTNDGYLWLMDSGEYWAICHRHRARWQISFDVIEDGFVPDGTEEWEEGRRPVSKYRVVEPIRLPDLEPEDMTPRVPYDQMFGRDKPQKQEKKKPDLRLVKSDEPGPDRPGSAPPEDEITWRGVLHILFVGIPSVYLRDIRESLGWA